MEIISDLHIHSRFARATSKDLTIDNLVKWARVKGLNLIGTGDFQHPKWNAEIKEKLEEDENGILWLKNGDKEISFIWQTEISLMFSQGIKKRRAVHLLVFAPSTFVADKIIDYLASKGRLDYDGRPIFGISCKQFVHDLKEIDDKIEIIPAHSFTPWFGLYGSDSGFDSLAECFEDEVHHIYAIESGMSADPSMIWRLRENINIVSFSDIHSFWPWRFGREATIFEIPELSYENIVHAIRTGVGLKATIETPPEYGKYHWDGHRNCNFSCSPSESSKLNGKCPVCSRGLTIGVENRIDRIAKSPEGFKPVGAKMFYKLLPLHELIALHYAKAMNSKIVWEKYNEMIEIFGNEFNILLKIGKDEILKEGIDLKLVELILLSRDGKLEVKPGFDGEYGQVLMPKIVESKIGQAKLF
ncbi:MAG: endonuclease Q family protein [Nanoarchaeota archaeon]